MACKWYQTILSGGACSQFEKRQAEMEAARVAAIAGATQIRNNTAATEAAAAALPGKIKTIAIYSGAVILLLIIIKYYIKK